MSEKFVFCGSIRPEGANVDIPSDIQTDIVKGETQGHITAEISDSELEVEFTPDSSVPNLNSVQNLIENFLHSVLDPLCFLDGSSVDFELSEVELPSGQVVEVGIDVPEVDGVDSGGIFLRN